MAAWAFRRLGRQPEGVRRKGGRNAALSSFSVESSVRLTPVSIEKRPA
jgi:hypothetical protein